MESINNKFSQLRAAELFCSKCKSLQSVKEKLLLILPDGELYSYLCVKCGEILGTRQIAQKKDNQIFTTPYKGGK